MLGNHLWIEEFHLVCETEKEKRKGRKFTSVKKRILIVGANNIALPQTIVTFELF
jgi:hypothetical protein